MSRLDEMYEFKKGDQAARIGANFTVCVVEQLMSHGYFVKWLDDESYGFLPKTDMEDNFVLVGRKNECSISIGTEVDDEG